jgi:hypothetical protein
MVILALIVVGGKIMEDAEAAKAENGRLAVGGRWPEGKMGEIKRPKILYVGI